MGLVISKGLTLKSYNTPAAIAGVAPTLDYRFALDRREIEAISLTDKLTYTGATNGTFVNRAGLIERATTDQPRFDHGPASRQSLGLLVEEQRTNLNTNSEAIDTYGTAAGSVSANQGVAPDGTTSADEISSTGGGRFKSVSGVTISTTYTVSIYAKYVSGSAGMSFGCDANPSNARVTFNLQTGETSSIGANVISHSIMPAGNSWYRCVVTFAATSTSLIFVIYNGTSGSKWLAWGAQLEVGSSPTSYIPTTTTALTRPVDSAVIDGTGVITGTYTLVEKPAGCAVVNGTNIDLVSGFTAERVMVFPAALSAPQITAIRGAM
jgi:hypothetical protein